MRLNQDFKFYFVFFIILFSLFSCNNEKAKVDRSYYFWRNKSYLEFTETGFLKQHQIHKLYTKILDIDWGEVYGAIPVSQIDQNAINQQLNYYDSLKINIVPVIFLTNKTFEKIDTSKLRQLALRIVRRCIPAYDSIDVIYEKDKNNNAGRETMFTPSEIQFDCDWTVSTSKKYFLFLQEFKNLLPGNITISATIRLHQYKYSSKTGIPPVDRGMLMMYNVNDPKKYESTNSIFDYNKANEYFTSNKRYPLPLDIVLPAYSWCLIFRNQKFYLLKNDIPETDLKQLGFLQNENNGFYRVTKDTVFDNVFLRIGDEFKPEEINIKKLQEAAELAHKSLNSKNYSIAFFELTENEIKNYKSNEIDEIYNSF